MISFPRPKRNASRCVRRMPRCRRSGGPRDLVDAGWFNVKVAVDETIAEARHIFQAPAQAGLDDPRFVEDREHLAIVAGPAKSLPRDDVMADVQTRFDHDLQFPLGRVLLDCGAEELLPRQGFQSGQWRNCSRIFETRLASSSRSTVTAACRSRLRGTDPDRTRRDMASDRDTPSGSE